MTLHWHDEAQIEFGEAAIHYEAQVEGLGEHFVTRIEAAAARILTNPLMPRCFEEASSHEEEFVRRMEGGAIRGNSLLSSAHGNPCFHEEPGRSRQWNH